jgi:N-acetylneuraminic acid mutarotase
MEWTSEFAARWAERRSSHPAIANLVLAGVLFFVPPALGAPGSWGQKQDIPMSVSGLPAGCVVNGIFYVIGGVEKTNFTPLNTVFAYDPKTDTWARKKDMPTARCIAAAASVDDIIYVIGGAIGKIPPGNPINTLEAYDPKTDTWTTKAPMGAGPRACLAACAVDGIIYAMGGTRGWPQRLNTVEAYDPKTNGWTAKTSLPAEVVFPAASVANGKIYAFMGTNTFEYDPKLDHWSTKAAYAPWSYALASATVDGTVYLFGGMPESMSGAYNFTLAYDPSQDRFTACRHMPRTRVLAPCGVIDGKVYLAAAVSKEPVVNPPPSAEFYTVTDVFDPKGGIAPQIVSLTCESTNSIRVAWQGETGIKYGIEFCPNLASRSWYRLSLPTGPSILATNPLTAVNCALPGIAKRFFRVVESD